MRKVLSVAIVTLLVFGAAGIFVAAQGTVSIYKVDENDEVLSDLDGISDEVLADVGGDTSVSGKSEVRVIKPKGIKGGTYEVKNEESTGEVLVIVDPIHVRG